MLVFVIGIVLLVICIIFTIIYNVDKYINGSWNAKFGLLITSVLTGLLAGGFLLFVSIGVLIGNGPVAHREARIKYETRVEELTNTRQAVLQIRDDYARSVAINEYNTNVREFKEDILTIQAGLDNLWINWFNNYEYKNFDANIVSYISEVN